MSSTDGPCGADAPGTDAPGTDAPGTDAAREPRPLPPGFPMAERSILPTVLGLPSVAALCVAAGGTGLGVLIDLLRIGTVGWAFSAFYFTGCVLGAVWVRRASLFGPMVAVVILALLRTDMTFMRLNTNLATVAQGVILVGVVMLSTFITLRGRSE